MKIFSLFRKLLIVLLVYLGYCGVSVCLYTYFRIGQETEAVKKRDVKSLEEISAPKPSNEEICVTSRMDYALALRCQLADSAKETLLISQYTIGDDDSGLIFIGKIFEAAKRGVKVKLLMNELSSKMRGSSRIPLAIFKSQPNIEVKFLGGMNPLKPWEVNNVMHDKLIIADDKYFLSSGRNIEKRFMLASDECEPTYDMDVIVKKTGALSEASLISQGTAYYNELWKNPYAEKTLEHRGFISKASLRKKTDEAEGHIRSAFRRQETLISQDVLHQLDFSTFDSAHLVHNEVASIVKEPVVWKQLTRLMNESKEAVTVQSPYVVVTKKMRSFLKSAPHSQVEFITNSASSSPNVFAFSGYLNIKDHLLENSKVWEYQGDGSLHQKGMLLDGHIGMVGSFNFDSRSAYLSTENMLIVNGKAFHDQLEGIMAGYKEQSLQAGRRFDYAEGASGVKVKPVPKAKQNLLIIMGWLTRPVTFLL